MNISALKPTKSKIAYTKPILENCLAIDTETNGIFAHKGCRPFTISACDSEGITSLWKFRVDPFTRRVIYDTDIAQAKIEDFRETIERYDSLIFHNANFDLQMLGVIPGIDISNWFEKFIIHDTIVMSHAVKSSRIHRLKELGVEILGYPDTDEKTLAKVTQKAIRLAKKQGFYIADKNAPHKSLVGTQKTWWKCDYWIPEEYAHYMELPEDHEFYTTCDKYATKDVVRTMGLYQVFEEMMDEDQFKSYFKARRLIKPIIKMQARGITLIDKELREARIAYKERYNVSLAKLRRYSGVDTFKPKQNAVLSKILFTTFKFKPKVFGKVNETTGIALPSSNKDVIAELLSKCPTSGLLPNKFKFLIELQNIRKIESTLTYLNNYYNHSRNKNHTLHPTFKQTSTGTNRLSAENPNTTNVGKKDMNNPFEKSKDEQQNQRIAAAMGIDLDTKFKLRNIFGPREGKQWICSDFDQSQLRIFAVLSESKELIDGFLRGDDAHHTVARVMFGKDDISEVERTAAKAINFGILFGAGPAKIDLLSGIKGLYTKFTSRFPNAKKYLEAQARIAKRRGYVYTIDGYRLYVPADRAYAASCYVIQGTEAEMVREAMVRVEEYTTNNRLLKLDDKRIPNSRCPFRMIMMVHDELVFESAIPTLTQKPVFDTHLQNIMNIMMQCGEELGIPSKVDAKISQQNWAERDHYQLTLTT